MGDGQTRPKGSPSLQPPHCLHLEGHHVLTLTCPFSSPGGLRLILIHPCLKQPLTMPSRL